MTHNFISVSSFCPLRHMENMLYTEGGCYFHHQKLLFFVFNMKLDCLLSGAKSPRTSSKTESRGVGGFKVRLRVRG